jgi:hypothetical protein
MFLPQSEEPSFAPIQHKWQNYKGQTSLKYFAEVSEIEITQDIMTSEEKSTTFGIKIFRLKTLRCFIGVKC